VLSSLEVLSLGEEKIRLKIFSKSLARNKKVNYICTPQERDVH
jgi:hypothetical protein